MKGMRNTDAWQMTANREQKTRDALEVPIRVPQQLKIISGSSIRIRFDSFQLTCLETLIDFNIVSSHYPFQNLLQLYH